LVRGNAGTAPLHFDRRYTLAPFSLPIRQPIEARATAPH
jgi:hypothetical protein